MSSERSRRWQMTENNPSLDKNETLVQLSKIGTPVYIAVCSEVGESGTKHNHAFVVFENAISLSSIKKIFPRAHLEPCKGSNEENKEYICKADVNFVESGKMPLTVSKERVKDVAKSVVNLLLEGATVFEVMSQSEYTDYIVNHFRALKEIENEVQRQASVKRCKRR